MKPDAAWTVRPADLRRMAASAWDPERQRKMLLLADALKEKDAELKLSAAGGGDARKRRPSSVTG